MGNEELIDLIQLWYEDALNLSHHNDPMALHTTCKRSIQPCSFCLSRSTYVPFPSQLRLGFCTNEQTCPAEQNIRHWELEKNDVKASLASLSRWTASSAKLLPLHVNLHSIFPVSLDSFACSRTQFKQHEEHILYSWRNWKEATQGQNLYFTVLKARKTRPLWQIAEPTPGDVFPTPLVIMFFLGFVWHTVLVTIHEHEAGTASNRMSPRTLKINKFFRIDLFFRITFQRGRSKVGRTKPRGRKSPSPLHHHDTDIDTRWNN